MTQRVAIALLLPCRLYRSRPPLVTLMLPSGRREPDGPPRVGYCYPNPGNLKTAKALGLTTCPILMSRGSRIRRMPPLRPRTVSR